MSFVENIISSLCSTALEVAQFLFKKVITEITTLSDPAQLFDTIFPGAADLDDAIYTIAIALGILFALASLFLTMTTSDSKSAESPISVVLRMFIFLPLTIWARQLCKVFYSIQSVFLQTLGAAEKADEAAGFIDVMVSSFGDVVTHGATTTATVAVLSLIVGLFFVILLFIDMLKLMMSIVEQYVLIGILAHLAPMAISTGCSKRTSQIFSSWLNMFISHLLIFILNQWSLSVFTTACGSLDMSVVNTGQSYGVITWVIALDAFLRLSQHWDQILNKLGLKSVGTGNGFMGSLIAATAIARSMGRHIGNAAKDGIKMAQGTWQPRPGSLAEALTSGARARSEATPGKAAGNAGVGYGKTQDKRFNEGFEAGKKDVAAGKPLSPLPIPSMDKSKQWQAGYKSAYAAAAAAAGGASVGANAMAGASAKNAGAVKAMRNDAMQGMRAATTRPSAAGDARTYPRNTTRIDPDTGKQLRVASDCASDARSLATASRLTNSLGSGTTLHSAATFGAPETLSIRNASHASFDAETQRGSMSFSGDVLDSAGKPIATFEDAGMTFMPDTPENREEIGKGHYAAFEVDIGTESEPEKYLGFVCGTACATDADGNVLVDKNGDDISFDVGVPLGAGLVSEGRPDPSGPTSAPTTAESHTDERQTDESDGYEPPDEGYEGIDDEEMPARPPDEPKPDWKKIVDDIFDSSNN